jgi:hypothetical protein
MKKILVILLTAMLFGCAQTQAPTTEQAPATEATVTATTPEATTPETPVTEAPEVAVHFYYSDWTEARLGVPAAKAARSLSDGTTVDLDAALSEQAEYNAAHTDDAILGPYIGAAVSVEEAPTVDGYIVNPFTHETLGSYLDIPRGELITNRNGWLLEAEQASMLNDIRDNAGNLVTCLIYVDHAPPVVEYTPPAPRLWVALLDTTARIVYYSERFDTEAEAVRRIQFGINPAVEQYNAQDVADGIDVPGHVWASYLGDVEATY